MGSIAIENTRKFTIDENPVLQTVTEEQEKVAGIGIELVEEGYQPSGLPEIGINAPKTKGPSLIGRVKASFGSSINATTLYIRQAASVKAPIASGFSLIGRAKSSLGSSIYAVAMRIRQAVIDFIADILAAVAKRVVPDLEETLGNLWDSKVKPDLDKKVDEAVHDLEEAVKRVVDEKVSPILADALEASEACLREVTQDAILQLQGIQESSSLKIVGLPVVTYK